MAAVHVTDSMASSVWFRHDVFCHFSSRIIGLGSLKGKLLSKQTLLVGHFLGTGCKSTLHKTLVAVCPVSYMHCHRYRRIAISANYAASFLIYRQPCSQPRRVRANTRDAIVREFDELTFITDTSILPGLSVSLPKFCGAHLGHILTFITNV
jgi:hypothetical protein